MIGRIYTGSENKLDWWLESTASRNPLFSQLQHQVTALMTLRKLIDDGHCPDKVKVDCISMRNAVCAMCKSANRKLEISTPSGANILIGKLRSLLSPFRSMLRIWVEWQVVRISKKKDHKRFLPADSLVLLDTFSIPGFVENDRYYPGLLEQSGGSARSIRFVPQFLQFSICEMKSAVAKLRKYPSRYIFKEDWLTTGDYVWCFLHLFRLRKVVPKEVVFRGLDITELVHADLKKRNAFRCSLRGLMNYRFARALNSAGVKPSKVIDWFENQPMDRGWNAGFNEFFPEVERVGYTGFFPAGQCYRPTIHEFKAGILPPKQLVIGDHLRVDMAEFFPHCCVQTGPAFRHAHFPELEVFDRTENLILVAMPYFPSVCAQILDLILQMQDLHSDWKFVIKPHPATSLDQQPLLKAVLAGHAELTENPIQYWLQKASLMLTGSQVSSILESAAYAVPAILLASRDYTAETSIPGKYPERLYCVCSDVAEFEAAAQKFLTNDQQNLNELVTLAMQFRLDYFSEVNSESISQFLTA